MNTDGLKKFLKTGIITPDKMRVVDKNCLSLGVTSLQLMESAGKTLSDCVKKDDPSSVLILCGSGNNGGDGFVAARHLSRSTEVHVLYPRDAAYQKESALNLKSLSHCRIGLYPVRCLSDVLELSYLFESADCIVDAILGTGAEGELREPFKTMADMANRSGAGIISADLPTPGIHADTVCAFHRPKQPGSDVYDIGIPVEAEIFTGDGDLLLVPQKKSDAHKGDGGRVLVIGGGPYQGAPYLAALSALRGGADIVRVATPNFMAYPDLITERLDGDYISENHTEKLIELAKSSDSVVFGCGLGERSHDVVLEVSEYCKKAVFDADALRSPLACAGESVYTPHSGEFERISGVKPSGSLQKRADCLRDFAKKNEGTFILKGKTDIITDGDSVRFNKSGSSAMTKGGTGDVLAGLCGALLCRIPAFDAACIAAYVNGRAGELAAGDYGDGIMAGDIIDRIPKIMYREE
ncbi:MAG: NAD(P)H-hydrate dehydratase [Methanomicrobiaceae archaeon]|nr:NAD(P)H-hydrate dehydratase [Methanomicrobiaceae archaeon]